MVAILSRGDKSIKFYTYTFSNFLIKTSNAIYRKQEKLACKRDRDR